jgi:hypothetical protein
MGTTGQPFSYNKNTMTEHQPVFTTSAATENTSGQGTSAPVPPEILGWNWGAFCLTWIWGVSHRIYLSLLALLPIPFVGLAASIVLGIKGNEWAWQFKKWDSIEQFHRTQRTWMYWGIASLVAPFVLILGLLLIIVGLLGYANVIRW